MQFKSKIGISFLNQNLNFWFIYLKLFDFWSKNPSCSYKELNAWEVQHIKTEESVVS